MGKILCAFSSSALVLLGAFAQQAPADASAFFEAAYKGETAAIRKAVANGTRLDQKDKYGNAVLTFAANGGHADTVAALLALGASPNEDGGHTLLAACTMEHIEIVRLLVRAGANVNASTGNLKRTPLIEAVFNGNVTITRYLMAHGADPNLADALGSSPLIIAALRDKGMVTLLLRGGAKVDQRDSTGMTALLSAAEAGKLETAQALIAAGAQVDARESTKGMTALHLASAGGHANLIHILLKRGANPNNRTTKQHAITPLMAAARSGTLDCVLALLNAKADPLAQDDQGHTALMYAAINQGDDVISALLKAGTPVDATDENGETALFSACRSANSNAVRALLRAGADPRIANYQGKHAFEYASEELQALFGKQGV